MLFDPRVIFIFLWLMECLGQILFGEVFGPFETETFVVVAIAGLAFLSGAQLIQQCFCRSDLGALGWVERRWPAMKLPEVIPDRFKLLAIFAYSVAAFFVMQRIVALTGVANVARPLECLRLMIVKDMLGEREITGLMKFFVFGVALSLYFLNDAANSSKKMLVLFASLGLLSAMASTGRLLVLVFFLASAYLMHTQKNWGAREIAGSLLAFLLLFYSMSLLVNKAPSEERMQQKEWSCATRHPNAPILKADTTHSQTANAQTPDPGLKVRLFGDSSYSFSATNRLVWNAQTYFLASLAAFNNFVKTGKPQIDGGAFLPNIVRSVLNYMGADLAMRPAVNPYADLVMPTNTYTALFPIYHDLGRIGVFVWFLFLGMGHQFLYRMSQKKEYPIFRYFYAISLYPLCMLVFEEAYASSLGFWTVFALTPLCLPILSLGWPGLNEHRVKR